MQNTASNPFSEGIAIAAEQVKRYVGISKGVHIMAIKAEKFIPEIIEFHNRPLYISFFKKNFSSKKI